MQPRNRWDRGEHARVLTVRFNCQASYSILSDGWPRHERVVVTTAEKVLADIESAAGKLMPGDGDNVFEGGQTFSARLNQVSDLVAELAETLRNGQVAQGMQECGLADLELAGGDGKSLLSNALLELATSVLYRVAFQIPYLDPDET